MTRVSVKYFHDITASDFDRNHDDDPFYSRIYEPLATENLQRILPHAPCRILDAGGGTGRWAIWLAGLGHILTLTDISQGMLNIAEEKIRSAGLSDRICVEHLDVADMSSLADGQFDLAMAQGDPLSYCSDPSCALAELARVTRPGGQVLVSVDSRIKAVRAMEALDWEQTIRILSSGEMDSYNPQNMPFRLHAFTVSELTALFHQCGLQVVSVRGIPVFFDLLSSKVQKQILDSEAELERYLEIEKRFADEPGWAGGAKHIQVIGIKD